LSLFVGTDMSKEKRESVSSFFGLVVVNRMFFACDGIGDCMVLVMIMLRRLLVGLSSFCFCSFSVSFSVFRFKSTKTFAARRWRSLTA
jgi:hypothetical protein